MNCVVFCIVKIHFYFMILIVLNEWSQKKINNLSWFFKSTHSKNLWITFNAHAPHACMHALYKYKMRELKCIGKYRHTHFTRVVISNNLKKDLSLSYTNSILYVIQVLFNFSFTFRFQWTELQVHNIGKIQKIFAHVQRIYIFSEEFISVFSSRKDSACKARVKLEQDGGIVSSYLDHTHEPPKYMISKSGVYITLLERNNR